MMKVKEDLAKIIKIKINYYSNSNNNKIQIIIIILKEMMILKK